MPYAITRHDDTLLWVVMEGQLSLAHAEAYYQELWNTLDRSPNPTDLLVDGRRIGAASMGARRRTEQIAHHPHLGHLAFVVSTHHLLIFAPFVRLVSGIGLFGHEQEALDYLRAARGLPSIAEQHLPDLPPQADPPQPAHTRPLPPPPASRIPLSRTRRG